MEDSSLHLDRSDNPNWKNDLSDNQIIQTFRAAGKLLVNVFSDTHPGTDFIPIEPDMEDAYFHILNSSVSDNPGGCNHAA